MTSPRVIHVASVAELRAMAAVWDDLWWRSNAALPTLRAELIARWMEHFAPQARFHALVVEDQGQWVAALPLVGRRVASLLSAGATLGNSWSEAADLLWDASLTADNAIGDALVETASRLPWQLLWLDSVPIDAPQWRAMRAALERSGVASIARLQGHTGRLHIEHDWNACQRRWSGNHRRKIARLLVRLQSRGDVMLQWRDRFAPQEVEPLLRQALEIENAGWKGAAGTSVLRTPGMFDFFLRQARQLAQWEQLVLATLRCGDTPVAFCYAMAAKGVLHSWKVGYDSQYADYGPGQLLRYSLIERLQGDSEFCALDFVGPLSEAQSHWRPETYPVARLICAPRRWPGRLALQAYRRLRGNDVLPGSSGSVSSATGYPLGAASVSVPDGTL
jgi:CelD/BcsL family acetyltransferase involved in cellulose biosynthesis